mmetsp:Transcript_72440/g.212279  ORF Transcript_72440/g.212279 Transcript_72440/m.212279 type:complete len:230 (-) Transcript_72440:302-991(-)
MNQGGQALFVQMHHGQRPEHVGHEPWLNSALLLHEPVHQQVRHGSHQQGGGRELRAERRERAERRAGVVHPHARGRPHEPLRQRRQHRVEHGRLLPQDGRRPQRAGHAPPVQVGRPADEALGEQGQGPERRLPGLGGGDRGEARAEVPRAEGAPVRLADEALREVRGGLGGERGLAADQALREGRVRAVCRQGPWPGGGERQHRWALGNDEQHRGRQRYPVVNGGLQLR